MCSLLPTEEQIGVSIKRQNCTHSISSIHKISIDIYFTHTLGASGGMEGPDVGGVERWCGVGKVENVS